MTVRLFRFPPQARPILVERDAGIAWILGRFNRFVRFQANRKAKDPMTYEDLVQEGEIALWEVEHWRLDLDDPVDRIYLRRMVRRRIERARQILQRQGRLPKRPAEIGARDPGWHPVSTEVGMNHVRRRTPVPE